MMDLVESLFRCARFRSHIASAVDRFSSDIALSFHSTSLSSRSPRILSYLYILTSIRYLVGKTLTASKSYLMVFDIPKWTGGAIPWYFPDENALRDETTVTRVVAHAPQNLDSPRISCVIQDQSGHLVVRYW